MIYNDSPAKDDTHTIGSCFIAETPEDRDKVYQLRYACYRRRESIEFREEARFSDHYDALPNSFSFLVDSKAAQAVATVRISVVRPDLGWTESPANRVFGDHPKFQAIAGESFVEASRLCFGQQARRDAFMRLLGNMAALASFYETKWLVACPRVEHASTYQRLFGFQELAEPRKYFGVNFQTQLLGVRTERLRAHVDGMKPAKHAWSAALEQLAARPPFAICSQECAQPSYS